MFFLRMITRSFTRQLRRRLLIALTGMPVGDRVRIDAGRRVRRGRQAQRRAVHLRFEHHRAAQADAVVSDLYNTESGGATSTSDPTAFLKESDAAKIKTIFWSFNITSFAPQLNIHATVNETNVPVVGTWFNKNLKISTGETTVVGVEGMRSWWQLDGKLAQRAIPTRA